MKRLLLSVLAFYRCCLSPVLHALVAGGCKFEPSCSRYAEEAIDFHGPARGGRMALGRLLRCHPFTRGGFDPVPLPVPLAFETPRAEASTTASLQALHDPLP